MVKNLPANAEDTGSILESGRLPREGNGNPLQYSCLGNSMDRGAWWATIHGVAKESDTTQQLNNYIYICTYTHTYIHIYTHMHTHIRSDEYIHSKRYIYAHAYMSPRSLSPSNL